MRIHDMPRAHALFVVIASNLFGERPIQRHAHRRPLRCLPFDSPLRLHQRGGGRSQRSQRLWLATRRLRGDDLRRRPRTLRPLDEQELPVRRLRAGVPVDDVDGPLHRVHRSLRSNLRDLGGVVHGPPRQVPQVEREPRLRRRHGSRPGPRRARQPVGVRQRVRVWLRRVFPAGPAVRRAGDEDGLQALTLPSTNALTEWGETRTPVRAREDR